MLVKEYRISLPMSVEEYRIAQLYMIQRKSREESHGAGSGVEIITNQPYTEGPGGSGQYTYKIYHIGSHLPGWFRAILPKSALRVEEEAWNAYPYTKTRYRCPFVEKFVLEVETRYLNDGGELDNIFGLSQSELKERTVDFIDIVKDNISSGDYRREEDPKIFVSKATNRGPLNDNWREEYSQLSKVSSEKKIMTAYKLCRVEFKYWGMQTKIERFIHDIGLRKTMLRAHRQAWCWQDEYHGLQLADIRKLEYETQLALQETMAAANENEDFVQNNESSKSTNKKSEIVDNLTASSDSKHSSSPKIQVSKSNNGLQDDKAKSGSPVPSQISKHSARSRSKSQLSKSKTSLDSSQVSDWRFQSLEQLQESSSDEDEFYDAQGEGLAMKSLSMETLSVSNDEFADARSHLSFDQESHGSRRFEKLCQKYSLETGGFEKHAPVPPLCKTNTLFLVVHGGSLLDPAYDHFNTSKRSDYNTLKTTFDTVIKSSYPSAKGRIAIRLVPCPQICCEALNVLSSLSPFGFDAMTPNSSEGALPWSQEFVPLGAVGLFSVCSPDYQDHVNSVIAKANLVFMDFLQSEEGKGFNGQVCILADATGSVLTYDALTRTRTLLGRNDSHHGSQSSDLNQDFDLSASMGSSHTLCENAKDTTIVEQDEDVVLRHKPDTLRSESVQTDSKSVVESSKSVKSDKLDDNQSKSSERDASKPAVRKMDSVPIETRHNSVRLQVTRSVETPGEFVRRTSGGSQYETLKFDFEVADFFMLGSPLGLVLAYRKMFAGEKSGTPLRPDCQQMYNLFHASDPSALRLEPLLNFVFRQIPPIKIARYNKFPMGDGESIQIVETVCHYIHMFLDQLVDQAGTGSQLLVSLQRQASVTSTCSQLTAMSAHGNTFSNIANVSSQWWGSKRLDYMLYCPEVLHSFPVRSLPPLFHASFWESTDVVSFVLRQVLQQDFGMSYEEDLSSQTMSPVTTEGQPKEKWQKRRTMYKVRNLQPNHRGNDVLVLEDKPQVLSAKFMYGPLDMTSLSGEKTDIHVMSASGEWTYMGTENTDGHGRLTYTIPPEKRLSQGIHPVKMVVRWGQNFSRKTVDHTTTDLFLAVLPPRTETIIFSIDGSFTASVSIMGKDPKVKPGAVDVVRHWQELGYLILYVTARPDMQHNKVVAWLAQHNFPHGMVAFMDGFSKDPLRQKFNHLKTIQSEAQLKFRAGYGSSKDVNGYRDLGLSKEQIFIVGKSNKKQQNLATFMTSGYAAHLEFLMSPVGSRPASGNAVFLLRKTCFSLPTSEKRGSKHRASNVSTLSGQFDIPGVSRPESGAGPQTLITVSDQGNTLLQPVQPSFGAAVRARGTSPRPKMSLDAHR
ncbi:protein retinal degeneration B-like isoform X3 [Ruditapes philippinarum]|uniref:protein retinal degeneration B-like isoform X3 n=1 Tax=Ruditapes philippinarum TaxID=129788 RepID=UPI00295A8FD1|nr:protein retinal degeneration B-like isoform X3 [Ruditapes philippinarum]